MGEPSQHQPCVPGCRAPVPPELEAERLCVLHFILSIEHASAEMRRETAMGRASAARQTEIANYVTATAMTLSYVATGSLRLSDDLKKRVLNTFLTLMNLRESLDRAASRCGPELQAPRSASTPAPVVVPG